MKHLSVVIVLFLTLSFITRAGEGIAKDSIKLANPGAAYGGDIIWSGIGAGIGMDYGGFGANYTAFVAKNVGLFAGFGFAYANVGYNLGVKVRFRPEAKLNPFVLGMFGYNAAFTATSEPDYAKVFTGFTAGIGIDYRAKANSKGYWTAAVLVPFQNDDVSYYSDWLNTHTDGDFQTWVHSVAFSIGYHWIIRGH